MACICSIIYACVCHDSTQQHACASSRYDLFEEDFIRTVKNIMIIMIKQNDGG